MGLKIVGAGFGRTGTMSVFTALNQLGFPCYHMIEVLENKANKTHLDFWRELMAAYPESKVLLTLHPKGPEAWYDSTIDTIYFTENVWQFKVLEWVTPFGRKMGDMCHKLIWQRSHSGTMDDKAKAIAHYRKHIEDVKAGVPAERLLVFSVDQGWEPLCKFLGVPVPSTPFPNVNDRAAVKKIIANITNGAYVILAAGAVILAALIYGAARLFG